MIAMLLSSCQDRPAATTKDAPRDAAFAKPAAYKPSCTRKPDVALDAPYRHEKWASELDVAALKSAAAKVNAKANRLTTELRGQILDQHSVLQRAELALASASDIVEKSCLEFLQAFAEFRETATRETQPSINALTDVVECWSYESDPRVELDKLGRELDALRKVTAVSNLASRELGIREALLEMRKHRATYGEASRQMASVMAKTATAAGLGKADTRTLTVAFEQLPKAYEIVQQLDLIAMQASDQREKLVISGSTMMCDTLGLLEMPRRANATIDAPDELRQQWDQRVTTVHQVIEDALAVPDTEW